MDSAAGLTEEDDAGESTRMVEQDAEHGLSKDGRQDCVQKQDPQNFPKDTDNTGMSGGNAQWCFNAGVNKAPVNVINNVTTNNYFGDQTDDTTRQRTSVQETTAKATEAPSFPYDRQEAPSFPYDRQEAPSFPYDRQEEIVHQQLFDKFSEELNLRERKNLKVLVIDLTKIKDVYRLGTKHNIEMTVEIAEYDTKETENIYWFLETLYEKVKEKRKSSDHTPSQGSMVQPYIETKFDTFEITLYNIPNEMFQRLTKFNVEKIVYLAEWAPDQSGPIHEFVSRIYINLANTRMYAS